MPRAGYGANSRGGRYLACPVCKSYGVSLCLARKEDGWLCRYCGWWAYTSGEDRVDVIGRYRLLKENPDATIWVSDQSPEAVQEIFNEPR